MRIMDVVFLFMTLLAFGSQSGAGACPTHPCETVAGDRPILASNCAYWQTTQPHAKRSMTSTDPTPPFSPEAPASVPICVLGVETSCDESAVAVVRRDGPARGEILANVVRSQWAEHSAYGGVVPEIAARAHVECIAPIARQALAEAGTTIAEIDLIAATAGPGLIGGLLAGLTFAKAMALAAGKPFVAVNHLEAHALTVGLTDGLLPPYLLLLVSGGHTQTVLVEDIGRYRRIGSTIDDALGEAFDKTAKILGLGYPGGPAVERAAAAGDPNRFALPRPLLGRPEANFSFAGLKTAVRRAAQRLADDDANANTLPHGENNSMAQPSGSECDPAPSAAPAEARPKGGTAASENNPTAQDISDLCASFEAAVCDTVVDRCRRAFEIAAEMSPGRPLPLVVSGGVAANTRLRRALVAFTEDLGTRAVFPPPSLCADNGVMIAWAGAGHFAAGHTDDLTFEARARWPLDGNAVPVIGAGRHGPKA
jgi:N6-L-threonylcarbamoyladenine synthase